MKLCELSSTFDSNLSLTITCHNFAAISCVIYQMRPQASLFAMISKSQLLQESYANESCFRMARIFCNLEKIFDSYIFTERQGMNFFHTTGQNSCLKFLHEEPGTMFLLW